MEELNRWIRNALNKGNYAMNTMIASSLIEGGWTRAWNQAYCDRFGEIDKLLFDACFVNMVDLIKTNNTIQTANEFLLVLKRIVYKVQQYAIGKDQFLMQMAYLKIVVHAHEEYPIVCSILDEWECANNVRVSNGDFKNWIEEFFKENVNYQSEKDFYEKLFARIPAYLEKQIKGRRAWADEMGVDDYYYDGGTGDPGDEYTLEEILKEHQDTIKHLNGAKGHPGFMEKHIKENQDAINLIYVARPDLCPAGKLTKACL
jgi:hypothetical protein